MGATQHRKVAATDNPTGSMPGICGNTETRVKAQCTCARRGGVDSALYASSAWRGVVSSLSSYFSPAPLLLFSLFLPLCLFLVVSFYFSFFFSFVYFLLGFASLELWCVPVLLHYVFDSRLHLGCRTTTGATVRHVIIITFSFYKNVMQSTFCTIIKVHT